MRKDVDPPVFVAVDVLNLLVPSLRHMVVVHQRMFLCWSLAVFPSSKQKVVVHRVRLLFQSIQSPSDRQTVWVWCPLSWHGPSVRSSSWCWCWFSRFVAPSLGKDHMAAATPAPGPSLGPSQVSLLKALDLLSNTLGPVEFDRRRVVLGLLLPPTTGTYRCTTFIETCV